VSAVTIYGQVSVSLALGAGLSYLPLPKPRLCGLVAAAAASLTLAPALHGLFGSLSFTLTQIALLRLLGLDIVIVTRRSTAAPFVAVAAIFYASALGIGPFDPFDLGYRSTLVLLLIPIGPLLAWRGEHVLLAIIGFDLLACGLGLFANLWSALLDPILVVVAAVRLFWPNARAGADAASPR